MVYTANATLAHYIATFSANTTLAQYIATFSLCGPFRGAVPEFNLNGQNKIKEKVYRKIRTRYLWTASQNVSYKTSLFGLGTETLPLGLSIEQGFPVRSTRIETSCEPQM
jgi:hypothetical protein